MPNASWIRRGFCRILRLMTASLETWKSYAQLLARWSPRISHILFANADGTSWWSSDPASASRVQYALSLLLNTPTPRHREIDGLMETEDSSESRYGFRPRAARVDLRSVHALIKPALGCLQGESSARAAQAAAANAVAQAVGEAHDSL